MSDTFRELFAMKLTTEQARQAARKLCELRGVDPDQLAGDWTRNMDVTLKEIEAFLELQNAIAFGAAIQPNEQPQPPAELKDVTLLWALRMGIDSFPPTHPDAKGLTAEQYGVALELSKARAVLALVQRGGESQWQALSTEPTACPGGPSK